MALLSANSLQVQTFTGPGSAGEPTGENKSTVLGVIKNAKNFCQNSQYGPGAISFEFAQVWPIQQTQCCRQSGVEVCCSRHVEMQGQPGAAGAVVQCLGCVPGQDVPDATWHAGRQGHSSTALPGFVGQRS